MALEIEHDTANLWLSYWSMYNESGIDYWFSIGLNIKFSFGLLKVSYFYEYKISSYNIISTK